MARRGTGRQKIEMKKISKESNLKVTFSRRHKGLLKKSSELCTLCDVEMAIIVFSPDKTKVFSFGHPNVKHVIDKFLNPDSTTGLGVFQPADPSLAQLNSQLTDLHDQLDTQMTAGKQLADLRKQYQAFNWWEASVEDLSLEQLKLLKSALIVLKTLVGNKRNNLVQMVKNSISEAEAVDGCGAPLGIIMTPQGYALC